MGHSIVEWFLRLWDSIVDWFGGNTYRKCMIFCNKYNTDAFYNGVNLGEFVKDYHWIMNNVMLHEFGIPFYLRGTFIDNSYTRWSHFIVTDEEAKKDVVDWAIDIVSEIFYCSSRWSLDKLIEISWMYSELRSKSLPLCGFRDMDDFWREDNEDFYFLEIKKAEPNNNTDSNSINKGRVTFFWDDTDSTDSTDIEETTNEEEIINAERS